MHIVRYRKADGVVGVAIREGDLIADLPVRSVAELLQLTLEELRNLAGTIVPTQPLPEGATILTPIDGRTEVWACGVTYERSRVARTEESSQRDVYELVYDAPRPELFFKSVAWRVIANGAAVAIRTDSTLDVPEPELALAINSHGEIVGYLVCNDMSSRNIEGENPLYLPQAKIFAGSCALSAGIRPVWEVDTADLAISLCVVRDGKIAFSGETSTSRLHRPQEVLVGYLTLQENFPDGAILSTGTGIVPGIDFTLRRGDEIQVQIEHIGILNNPVTSGKSNFEYLADEARTS